MNVLCLPEHISLECCARPGIRRVRHVHRALRAQKTDPRLAAEGSSAFSATQRCMRLASPIDAHRGDGKRFVVRADEKLTAFWELESAIRGAVEMRISHS